MAWLHRLPCPTQSSLLTASRTGIASCPSLSPAPWSGNLYPTSPPSYPDTWGPLVEGGMELIKMAQPQIILTPAGSYQNPDWAEKGRKEAKKQTCHPGPHKGRGFQLLLPSLLGAPSSFFAH